MTHLNLTGVGGDYFQSSKGLADEGYFLGHGVGVINAVFSGGRPATTGARCVYPLTQRQEAQA